MFFIVCRIYQLVFRILVPLLVRLLPRVLTGTTVFSQLAGECREKNITAVLLVTDTAIVRFKLIDHLLDAFKAVGARVAHPHTPMKRSCGVIKVLHKIPLLAAVPTTPGTGSDASVSSLISDPVTHEKTTINDPMYFNQKLI